MAKITWDLDKEKFPQDVHSVIICNECGWLVTNPIPKRIIKLKTKKEQKRAGAKEIIYGDLACDNCRKTYAETHSEVQKILRKEKRK